MTNAPTPLPPLVYPKCSKCKATFFLARLPPGVWIEIKCYRCNTVNVIERKAA